MQQQIFLHVPLWCDFQKVHSMTPNHLGMLQVKSTSCTPYNIYPRSPICICFILQVTLFELWGYFQKLHWITMKWPWHIESKKCLTHSMLKPTGPIFFCFILQINIMILVIIWSTVILKKWYWHMGKENYLIHSYTPTKCFIHFALSVVSDIKYDSQSWQDPGKSTPTTPYMYWYTHAMGPKFPPVSHCGWQLLSYQVHNS